MKLTFCFLRTFFTLVFLTIGTAIISTIFNRVYFWPDMLKNLDTPHKLNEPVPRSLCTDCGISRTKNPSRCGTACQFIKPDYPKLETQIHGRERDENINSDELHFGTFKRIVKAKLKSPSEGAQWTGITTQLAEQLLAHGLVDAVIAVKPNESDRWKPEPVLVTKPEDMKQCRGMRMGYAPTLALLEPAIEQGHKRIAVVGIPCQIYALRALEKELGLEKLYVIGTPCSDNTTTENFHTFLNLLSDEPETVSYLEFRADYQVELRFDDGKRKEIPFLKRSANGLPLRAMPDFVRPIVAWLMPKIGPRGMEFARTRLEMKAIETILHLRRKAPSKMKNMIPEHVWKLAKPYGLKPEKEEKS